ncbi:MAG: HD family phosphohydrolase [Anaerolineaceae bacterium]
MPNFIRNSFHTLISRQFYRIGLLLAATVFSYAALVLPIALRPSSYPISIGAVSNTDIVAPFAATFESKILTQKAQKDAANAISPIYLPSDPTITRTQIDNLHIILNYIDTVRADSLASISQKSEDLSAISSISLSSDSATMISQLPDSEWKSIEQESLAILEQIMRKNIRDYQVQDNRSSIPNLIELSFSNSESKLIQELVTPFIVANSLYSESETQIARDSAISGVGQVNSSYIQGQAIVLRGQVISAEQYEALQYFDFVKPKNKLSEFLPPLLIVGLILGFISLYFERRKIYPISDLRSLTLIAVTYLIFLFAARAIIPNRAILPYLFPLSAFAMMLATLFSLEISVVFSLALCIVTSFGLQNSIEITSFYLFSCLIGALVVGKGRRVSSFFWAGIFSALAGSIVILAYRFLDNTTDLLGIATLTGVTLLNGIASASLALLFQLLASQILGLTTPLNLLEISRPDNPLLQFILQNAPGTYQHSLQVSNLAEQGAKAIGADQLLTRVGALYHDCGKASNASFFIENQIPGKLNSHEDMAPSAAAEIIINHIHDGIALAERNHLPPRIKDFIREHHGTGLTRYQFGRALELAGGDRSKIDDSNFHYPGPKPRSKETALLMLADGCEARARAELPKTDEELIILINKVIDGCIVAGQLEESNLTLKDLKIISETFFNAMLNTHHPRLVYPETEPANLKTGQQ